MMLGIRSFYGRTSSSTVQQVVNEEESDLDDGLEDMELCDESDFNHGLILMGSKYQNTLRTLYNLIVKKDGLKIRLPMHWEMDLLFTEVLTKDHFGQFGETQYEVMLPSDIFMIDNIHFKGLVRYKNILNLPNKIRGLSLTNKLGLKENTHLIHDTILAYITWLIDQCFNTHEERKSSLKLFKSEYLLVRKSKAKFKSTSKTMKIPRNPQIASDHLTYIIDISLNTVTLAVYDNQQRLYNLIKFNLKRDFRIQKFQNQVDIEFSLKLTMFIELARREMMENI